MGRKSREKLAKRLLKKAHIRDELEPQSRSYDIHYEEVEESNSIQSCLQNQAVWLTVMMVTVYAEVCRKKTKFPVFGSLFYIWDDYLPIMYLFLIFVLRHCVPINQWSLYAVMAFAYLSPIGTSLWYIVNVIQHTMEFGFPLWEDYPYGVLWWFLLLFSHVLRCQTISAFVHLMLTWDAEPDIVLP